MHYLKKIAYLALIALHMMPLHADVAQTVTPIAAETAAVVTPAAEQLDELKQAVASIPLQTQRLRLILAAIIQKSEPALLKNIDHAQVRAWALDMQQFLKDVYDNIPSVSPESMALKAQVNHYCAGLLATALQAKLITLPAISPQTCLKALPEQFSFAFLLHTEMKTRTLLETLEPAVKNLGLSMGNKITRSAEVFWKEHKLSSRLPWLLLAGAVYYGGNWVFDPTKHTIKVDEKITKTFTNLDYIKELSQGFMVSGSGQMAATLATTALATTWGMISKAKNNISTTMYEQWNKLKGTESILDAEGYQAIDDNTVTFDSEELIGLEEQRKEIQPILDCCNDLDDFVRRGNSPQYGTLLIGPSGCGKTMFSRALAGTIHQLCKANGQALKVMFKELSCIDLMRFSLRDHIAEARKQGGVVVLFIDEVHNLSMQTNRNSYSLNDFLTQMADLYKTDVPNSYVFLVAATNQPELLGTSLLVPGRFGKIIRFSYPNSTKRADLFKRLLPRAGVNPESIDIASLVRQTSENVSFGKLRSIINEARITAEGAGEIVGQKHLQESIDALVHRFKQTIELTATEKKMVAAYQASKALAYTMLESNLKVERITIGGINQEVQEVNEYNGEKEKQNPNKSTLYTPAYGSVILYHQQEALHADDILEQKKQCKALVAGSCGQDLLLNTHSAAYNAADMQQAIRLAQEIVLDGKSFEDLSENRQNEVKDKAEALVTAFQQEMHLLLSAHKDALNALVAQLEKEITISGEAAQALLKQFVIAGM